MPDPKDPKATPPLHPFLAAELAAEHAAEHVPPCTCANRDKSLHHAVGHDDACGYKQEIIRRIRMAAGAEAILRAMNTADADALEMQRASIRRSKAYRRTVTRNELRARLRLLNELELARMRSALPVMGDEGEIVERAFARAKREAMRLVRAYAKGARS